MGERRGGQAQIALRRAKVGWRAEIHLIDAGARPPLRARALTRRGTLRRARRKARAALR